MTRAIEERIDWLEAENKRLKVQVEGQRFSEAFLRAVFPDRGPEALRIYGNEHCLRAATARIDTLTAIVHARDAEIERLRKALAQVNRQFELAEQTVADICKTYALDPHYEKICASERMLFAQEEIERLKADKAKALEALKEARDIVISFDMVTPLSLRKLHTINAAIAKAEGKALIGL